MQPAAVPDDVALGARDRVTVVGPDAPTFLQSQVSQDLEPLAIGESAWTLVLTPNGKVVSLARVTKESPERLVLDTDAGYGTALAERLGRFKIRVDVEITVEDSNDASGSAAPEHRDAELARIRARWPRMGAEIISGETVPAGLGLNDVAVSFTKGCYPGQELIERMDARGAQAPKTLRVVEVDEGARPGTAVLDEGGEQIGEVTSVVGTTALAWIRRNAE